MKSDDVLNTAFQLTFVHIFEELGRADPKLKEAIRRGFEQAADAAQVLAMKDPDSAGGETSLRVLDVIEQFQRMTLGEGATAEQKAARASLIQPPASASATRKAERHGKWNWFDHHDGSRRANLRFANTIGEMIITTTPQGDDHPDGVRFVVWVGSSAGYNEMANMEEMAEEFAERVNAQPI